jgi:hypothetical protein
MLISGAHIVVRSGDYPALDMGYACRDRPDRAVGASRQLPGSASLTIAGRHHVRRPGLDRLVAACCDPVAPVTSGYRDVFLVRR